MNEARVVALLAAVLPLAGCEKEKPTPPPRKADYAQKADYTEPEPKTEQAAIRFTDITQSAGIDFKHQTGAFGNKWMPETMGSGGGFLDYDNDARPDLLLVNGSHWPGHEEAGARPTLKLYRNKGGEAFEDVTTAVGLDLTLYGMGCAFADYDGDGDMDIYVTAVGDNKLLRNDGKTFTDVTAEAGVDPDGGAWSTGAAWVDVDRDGRPDLFVCDYVKWTPQTDLFTTLDGKTKSYATPQQYQGQSCRLYRNQGGGRFEDVTEKAGVLNDEGKSLGVAVADFNADGWPDVVVANDTQPNFLYINRGDGSFTDAATSAGIGYDEVGRARAGMGIDVADLRHDGRLSIAIGNFSGEPLSLYTQLDRDSFQDMAGKARLTKPTLLALTFGVLFADLDLDGYADLITANGHIEPEINSVQQDITFAQRPQLFRNDGAGGFIELTDQAGEAFAEPIVGRGVATADIDDDGDLDVLITVNGGGPKLLRNDLPADRASWIKLCLKGNAPNTMALGALVTIKAGELVQRCMVRTGSSYLSQSDCTLVCGLGKAKQADQIEIRWPSGKSDTLGPASAGRRYVIDETAPSLAWTEDPGTNSSRIMASSPK